jgi:hypothetical protein
VKRKGEWLKPLKFLGLEYDGVHDIFRAHTRNGSQLEFNKQELIMDLEKEGDISSLLRKGELNPAKDDSNQQMSRKNREFT